MEHLFLGGRRVGLGVLWFALAAVAILTLTFAFAAFTNPQFMRLKVRGLLDFEFKGEPYRPKIRSDSPTMETDGEMSKKIGTQQDAEILKV